MRILVLQLARFGDIYQTWPTLRALQRKYPEAELHVLVRERFAEALDGFSGIIRHALPTQNILEPLWHAQDEEAHQRLTRFFAPIVDLDFSLVVNLSFSPASSYMTDLVAGPKAQVRGYTRHSDGHLQIPDDPSAYFFAQVGIDRGNRHHVIEVFAAVADVVLCAEDFGIAPPSEGLATIKNQVVVHLGASTNVKVYPPELWVGVIQALIDAHLAVTLIGSSAELGLSEAVLRQVSSKFLTNLVGQTTLTQLMTQIQNSVLVIGSDSAPIHMASLAGTCVLNLSSAKVNFWETGPLTAGSRILYAEDLHRLTPEQIAREALALLSGEPPVGPCVERPERLGPYQLHGLKFEDFRWNLIQALYSGGEFPKIESEANGLAFQRLYELAELALAQLDRFENAPTQSAAAAILAQIDTLLPEVGRLNPQVEPVVQWFQTQRLRIPPAEPTQVLHQTRAVFQELLTVCAVYRQFGPLNVELRKARSLCVECVPEIREYNLGGVQSSFQSLISILTNLAARSTKVAELDWPSVLTALNGSLHERDFISLADILEWRLVPAFTRELDLLAE